MIDLIYDDTNIEEEYIKNYTISIVRDLVKNLPSIERKIIMLHFGFYNDRVYTETEIASLLGFSQSYVSKINRKTLNSLKSILEGQKVYNANSQSYRLRK